MTEDVVEEEEDTGLASSFGIQHLRVVVDDVDVPNLLPWRSSSHGGVRLRLVMVVASGALSEVK